MNAKEAVESICEDFSNTEIVRTDEEVWCHIVNDSEKPIYGLRILARETPFRKNIITIDIGEYAERKEAFFQSVTLGSIEGEVKHCRRADTDTTLKAICELTDGSELEIFKEVTGKNLYITLYSPSKTNTAELILNTEGITLPYEEE